MKYHVLPPFGSILANSISVHGVTGTAYSADLAMIALFSENLLAMCKDTAVEEYC